MENEFCIRFSHNGTHYKAAVHKKGRGVGAYFRVEYNASGLAVPPSIIFVKLNEDDPEYANPFWEQCPGSVNLLEEGFISAIGREIEMAGVSSEQPE